MELVRASLRCMSTEITRSALLTNAGDRHKKGPAEAGPDRDDAYRVAYIFTPFSV